jgi:hypothetical protein
MLKVDLICRKRKIPNDFSSNCQNIAFVKNLIKTASIKYKQDKGKQERSLCLILACLIGPGLQEQGERQLFNDLVKRIFDIEPSSLIEELLSTLLKEQLNKDELKVNQKQLQKMIDMYTGLRVNQCVIVSGAPLQGKTTLWQTLVKAINSLQTKENESVNFVFLNLKTKFEKWIQMF